MFDPLLNKSFSMNGYDVYDSEFWEDAVPIWVTNQLEGHKSGAAMWPGTDVRIHNVYPSWYLPYKESVPFEDRVDHMIEWFNEKLINFGLLYWEEPDSTGHFLGPDHPLMEKVVAEVDAKLGYLVDRLKKAKLWGSLNVIVTSDHGMAQSSLDRIIELDTYIDRQLYTVIDHSPVVAILPKDGKRDEVYYTLAGVHPNMTVYRKEDIPSRFRYRDHVRIQPIILVADLGWSILQNRSDIFLWGDHGYDNLHPDMHPLLIASGPAFKTNFTQETMSSTDVYPLLCHLLDITPLPNNGSLSHVMDLLVNSTHDTPIDPTDKPEPYAQIIGVFLGTAIVILFLLVLLKHLNRNKVQLIPEGHSEITQPLLS
ncbi:ectonucleotide pyrophosphatase/phosphodiesterase family member 5 [Pelodytes ibericus]